MKYAIDYSRDFRYINEVDEIIINFKKENNNLLDFVTKFKEEQRIIVDITTLQEEDIARIIPNIQVAAAGHKNLALRLSIKQQAAADFYELNIPYFFAEFADTWDKLVSLVSMGVTDVYIVSDLGFDLHDVSIYCKKRNIKIRVFPNVSQFSSKIGNIEKVKGFFIRPEDIPTYEEYVDVCEIFGDIEKHSVFYEIYKNNKWLGDLKDLILNFDVSVMNKTLPHMFGELRTSCKKDCYRGKCNKCDRMLLTAEELKERNLIITKK